MIGAARRAGSTSWCHDVVMPEMDGPTLLEGAAQEQPDTRRSSSCPAIRTRPSRRSLDKNEAVRLPAQALHAAPARRQGERGRLIEQNCNCSFRPSPKRFPIVSTLPEMQLSFVASSTWRSQRSADESVNSCCCEQRRGARESRRRRPGTRPTHPTSACVTAVTQADRALQRRCFA